MSSIRSYLGWLVTGASALALAGCGGGHGSSGSMGAAASTGSTTTPTAPVTPAASAFTTTALVSNIPGATTIQDPNLQHGWGIAFGAGQAVWVNAHAANKSTLYDGNGNIQPLVVAIPNNAAGAAAGPTGIVANATTNFNVTKNGVTAPASFLFAGTGGTISGWSQNVDNANAITAFDGSSEGDVYTGLAIFTQGTTNLLLAANASKGTVDVFDTNFKKTTVAGGFTDANVPDGYKPFGIQTIGAQVFVSYAHFTTGNPVEDHGAGLGFVDIFDATGTFVKRLVNTGGALNAPWGMAMAPSAFGQFSNDLLVGDFGDGTINVYDPSSGASLGQLKDSTGKVITISGLWGIAFGNDAFSQPSTTLFFAAGPAATQGVYGRVDLASATTTTTTTTPPPSNSILGY